jgi:hypothetical protein
MRFREDLGVDATDSAYAHMIAHPEISHMSTRDAASAVARPDKIDTAAILASAARIVEAATAAGKIATASARDGVVPSIRETEEARVGEAVTQILKILTGYAARLASLEVAEKKKLLRSTAPPPVQQQQPALQQQTKDTAMHTQNPGLAPHRNLTFPTKTRDRSWSLGQIFGEQGHSRFSSENNYEAGRTLPDGSAGLPSRAELTQRDDTGGMLELARKGRAGAAPSNTPYSLNGSGGREQHGENCVNVKGPPGNMATSVDPAEAFSNELAKIPSTIGNMPKVQNILHEALSKTRDSATKDAIEKALGRWMTCK